MTGTARRLLAAAAAGALAVSALLAVPPAWAWWSDTGQVRSGTFTALSLSSVTATCTATTWGQPHSLTFSGPAGLTYNASITSNPDPQGLSYWTGGTGFIQEGAPYTGAATTVRWGIDSNNPLEATTFNGTWTVVATVPGTTWSVTRSGTWQIAYFTRLTGTLFCT